MIVNYRVWLKDRENPKSRMQFITTEFHVTDMLETAHNIMLSHTDFDWICYRVDLVSISDFVL